MLLTSIIRELKQEATEAAIQAAARAAEVAITKAAIITNRAIVKTFDELNDSIRCEGVKGCAETPTGYIIHSLPRSEKIISIYCDRCGDDFAKYTFIRLRRQQRQHDHPPT